jgi:hypothetical protein
MNEAPRFPFVTCSQCGREFGPGDHGYSHCRDHAARDRAELAARGIRLMRTPPLFVAVGRSVVRGENHVAIAISHTMAKRISRALNNHVPNSRGY